MAPERRSRPEREAPELGAMMGRMLAALVRRATAGDLFALEVIALMRREVDQALVEAARGAHEGPGAYSWTEIARELGITRQAARQQYGRKGDLDGA